MLRPHCCGYLFAGAAAVSFTPERNVAGRDLRQTTVGGALLVERRAEKIAYLVESELARQSPGGAVAGDLVMLDTLGRCDQRRITCCWIPVGLDDLVAFLDDPGHRVAALTGWVSAQLVERLLEPGDVPACLLQVLVEHLFSSGVCAAALTFGSAVMSCCSASYRSPSWPTRTSLSESSLMELLPSRMGSLFPLPVGGEGQTNHAAARARRSRHDRSRLRRASSSGARPTW